MESYICCLDMDFEGNVSDSSDPKSPGTTSDVSTDFTASDTPEYSNSASIVPASDAPTDPRSIYYHRDGDVRVVRQLLLHHLPLELADIILDLAMYWPRVVSHNTQMRVARASHQPRNDASFVYLVTPPIPPFSQMNDTDDTGMYGGDRPAKVHMVQFSLTSHDQGWGGDVGLLGPYDGSHTWFEACIYRFATGDFYPESSEQANGEAANGMMWVTRDELQGGGFVTQVKSAINGKQTWLIQRNVRASSEVRHHRIIWEDTDVETSSGGDEDPDTGCGRGTGFVRSLSGGDRIALIVRALYPGWENHVLDAQVEVFYSI